MDETTQWISGCVTAVVLLATVIIGPSSCINRQDREITKRVEAACSGDLSADAARASACTLALMHRPQR